ncbi:MAG TPA: tyrosine/phenylalanine carboxypeptidase domain-containing protein [Polyangiaceae bacterium]
MKRESAERGAARRTSEARAKVRGRELVALEGVCRHLLRAERTIALLERCQPLNWAAELQRLGAAWSAGDETHPVFVYRRTVDFAPLCASLSTLAETLDGTGQQQGWLADRARELLLEARIAGAVGTPEVVDLATQRFAAGSEAEEALAQTWARARPAEGDDEDEQTLWLSHDATCPNSLITLMQKDVGRRRLPFRIVVRDDMSSAAATGEGVVYVRAGLRHRRSTAERIVLHEIEGHALPRYGAALKGDWLLSCGVSGASDDEEGRALWLERTHGYLGASRRRELGQRHLAALGVRRGAEWADTVRLLRVGGASLERALAVASRVHRGGGLARECVYIPALARVERAFAARPELDAWLARGRLSLRVAEQLADAVSQSVA